MGKGISIIIPIYKVEEYLEECLVSVVNQSYKDFEVLLINDGSPDKSEEICREFVDKDHRFCYYYQENAGVSSARNVGLEKASFQWIAFVDPDDTLMEDYLLNLTQNFDDVNKMIVFDVNRIQEDGDIRPQIFGFRNEEINLKKDAEKLFDNQYFLFGNPFNKLFNLEVIKRKNLTFKEGQTLGEDRIFVYEYLENIETIVFSSQAIYNYRYRAGSSINKKHHYSVYLNLLISNEKLYNFLNIPPNKVKSSDSTSLFIRYIKSIILRENSFADVKIILQENRKYIQNKYLKSAVKRYQLYIYLYRNKMYFLLYLIVKQLEK